MDSFFQTGENKHSIESQQGFEHFEQLERMGLVDRVALRNHKIRHDFTQMQLKGLKMRDIEDILGDKYFLSPESIHRIMYDTKSK